MAHKIFVFDFDGTLVDSYSCRPNVYGSIANYAGLQGEKLREFVCAMIKGEDHQDILGSYNRCEWWPSVFEEFGIFISEKQLIQLVRNYWKHRAMESTVMDHTEKTLRWLKDYGILAIACRGDGKYGNKKERIQKSVLRELFDNIAIVGEDAANITQAIESLMNEYDINSAEVMFIDDTPSVINEISQSFQSITTVQVYSNRVVSLAPARECKPTHKIRSIKEVETVADLQ